MEIIKERLIEIENKNLYSGSGKDLDKACIMQMVSYVAGEAWTDHPECACPVLTYYAIRINDRLNDDDRQKLKPLIPLLIGTRLNDTAQIARKRLIIWRNVTVTYSYLLDIIKANSYAEKLRSFKNTKEGMEEAKKYLIETKNEIRKIADAYAYANADANAYADADAYAYANADANAYANADANAYANADANADANANAYAYAYANANANANADANAYAYAKKIRSDIADISVETLRLAIEVKE